MRSKNKSRNKNKAKEGKRSITRGGAPSGRAAQRADRPAQELPTRQCPYLDRVAAVPKLFSESECEQIIRRALSDWRVEESMLQRDEAGKIEQNFIEDPDYRNTTLFVPPAVDEWLFSKILDAIMTFNNDEHGYGFDLLGMAEVPNMMRYQAADINDNKKPGKYDWHLDVGPGSLPSMRKISYSVLLNPHDYTGGELTFRAGRDSGVAPGQHGKDAIGHMIIFPAYLEHSVAAVTQGTRYSLVGWVHGNSFR